MTCSRRRVAPLPPAAVLLVTLAFAAAAAAADPAEGAGDDRPADSAAVVRASLRPALLTARPGGTVSCEVGVVIDKGWHLYAHGDTTFYGVSLAGLEGTALAGAQVEYPRGEPAEFFGQPVRLLAGRQRLRLRATLPADAAPGTHLVPLALEVQACDDEICLAPARLSLPLRLEVKAAGR